MKWTYFKLFYTRAVPAGQDPFKETVSQETRKEIRDLIDKEELRAAFDKQKIGYTGYRPRYDVGPLRKKFIPQNPYEQILQ